MGATVGATTGVGVGVGAGVGVGVGTGVGVGVGWVTLTTTLVDAPAQFIEYVVFDVGETLILPEIAFPVEKLVPEQLDAFELDHDRVDELPLMIEVGFAEIVAVGVGAGAGATAAGLVTEFASNVTAVCASALPVSDAPVFMTIAV